MNLKKLLCVITAVSVLLLCTAFSVQANYVDEVRVSNVDELLAAISSDTKIIMESGVYEICGENVYYEGWDEPYYEGKNLRLENITNLEIEGEGYVEIILDVGNLPVIEIGYGSSDIVLTGLTLGHDVPEYSCEGEGNVISVYGGTNITINDCDLYGCGVVGISGSEVGDITVNNTKIRDCSTAAVRFWGMTGNAVFNDCVFVSNAYDSFEAQYSDCFEFYAYSEYKDVYTAEFNNCVIEGNMNTGKLKKDGVQVSFNDCTESNNVWETSVNVEILNTKYDYRDRVIFDDQKAVIVEDRTLIPVRGLFESIGYRVEWDAENAMAVISGNGKNVKIPVGKNIIYKDGTEVEIDVPAQIINDRTMIPLRAVGQALDLGVDWEAETRTAIIIK